MLRGDRGITYAPSLPAGSRLVAGEWWPADYSGPPLVSLEQRTADDLKLKIGDTITVNVLGRNLTARIANLRAVDWQSLGINFVLVFSPGAFAGAPHTDIATLTFADGGSAAEEAALVKALADAFPTVSAIRVKDALDTIDHLVGNLVLGLRGASSVALIAAALVLGGALAAGQRFRIYDAVILKTLGATRLRLVLAYAVEYLLIGLAAVVFGVGSRLGDRRACDHPRDGIFVRLDGRTGAGDGGFRASCHRPSRACRHFQRARPQTCGGLKESVAGGDYEGTVTFANIAFPPSGAITGFRIRFQARKRPVFRTELPGANRDNPGVFSMSDFDRNIAAARTGYRTDQVAIDAGLRAYMIRVYNYMTAGVALTGAGRLVHLSGRRRRSDPHRRQSGHRPDGVRTRDIRTAR